MAWFITFNRYIKTLDYIIFGIYSNDDYGHNAYIMYKLTRNELYVDTSETWHTKNDFRKKYKFHGHKASNEKFEIAKELIHKVPRTILSEKVKKYGDNFGSKLQDSLIVELFDGEEKSNICIDSYIIATKKLPHDLRNFRKQIEQIITKLGEK